MSTALLVLLAVSVAVVTAALLRRRAVTGRRGAFKAKIRVLEGEIDGLSGEWKTGYGHWVRDVLVWTTAPLLVRTRLIPVDGTDASGIHANGIVAGLGKRSIVAPLVSDRYTRLELAAAAEDRDLALGPFARTCEVGSLVRARFTAEDSS
jgi:hypothetical protein